MKSRRTSLLAGAGVLVVAAIVLIPLGLWVADGDDDDTEATAEQALVDFYSLNRPQSVYLAFEGSDLQIEVFHPTPRQARTLVSTGRVRPVG